MYVITKEQSDMIDLILQGHSITDIAKNHLKLHNSTLYRWMDKIEVKAELEERRKHIKKAASDKITSNILQCVDNMIDMANNSTDPRVRLQANKYLLDQCIGSPTTAKEEKASATGENKNADVNTIKKELEALKVIK